MSGRASTCDRGLELAEVRLAAWEADRVHLLDAAAYFEVMRAEAEAAS